MQLMRIGQLGRGVGDFPNACHQQYGAPASTDWG